MPTKKKKYYEGKIPFANGKHYLGEGQWESFKEQQPYKSSHQDGFEWHDNSLFYANLEFKSMSRGRSAANFEAVLHQVDGDVFPEGFLEGCHVNIFMVDMLEIIKNCDISKGITNTHLWTFCKRGGNYGLQLVND